MLKEPGIDSVKNRKIGQLSTTKAESHQNVSASNWNETSVTTMKMQ